MRLQDIMSTTVRSIAPYATIDEARRLMRLHGIRHLLVKEAGSGGSGAGKVVGILSERDLGGRPAARAAAWATRLVSSVMTTGVVTAPPETTVRQAANLLRGRSIGCLLVSDGRAPVGIVTTTDLLELLGRGVARPIEESTRWTLRSRGVRGAAPTARRARGGADSAARGR